MSNYVKITDYAAKDALLIGNPSKVVSGTEIGADFDAVATAVATKVDSGGALGTPSSGTLTNCTGTAAGLTAGTVTTNANLTGHVTSVGNAAVLGSFTIAQLNTAVSDANVAQAGANSDITSLAGLTTPLSAAQGGTGTTTGIPSFASSAENIAGTVEDKIVDPLGIREAFNCTGSAPVYACRAWVNFNGTGTVAIRASGNVSSITDNGTGLYTVNLTTAISDAKYGHQVFSTDYTGVSVLVTSTVVSQLAGSMQIQTQSNSAGNGVAADKADVNVTIFR